MTLLDKIEGRVGQDRYEVWDPLLDIYRRCERLPENSTDRRTMERLVIAIWKRGEEKIEEEDVWKLDTEALGLIRDLGRQAGRAGRL